MLIGIFDQLGAQIDRLRCEVCQNLILSPMNTGLLRYAVATALTVHGIETLGCSALIEQKRSVATALTVHGIETLLITLLMFFAKLFAVATALTVHGIETLIKKLVHTYHLQR